MWMFNVFEKKKGSLLFTISFAIVFTILWNYNIHIENIFRDIAQKLHVTSVSYFQLRSIQGSQWNLENLEIWVLSVQVQK